jgi:hypothetical protein
MAALARITPDSINESDGIGRKKRELTGEEPRSGERL